MLDGALAWLSVRVAKLVEGGDHVITLCDKAREACPAFDHEPLRLLLSGPTSSGARATPEDARGAVPRNRIHLVVEDLDAEVARLRDAGLPLLGEPVAGPGGRQILLADPAGNLVELFQPADSSASTV